MFVLFLYCKRYALQRQFRNSLLTLWIPSSNWIWFVFDAQAWVCYVQVVVTLAHRTKQLTLNVSIHHIVALASVNMCELLLSVLHKTRAQQLNCLSLLLALSSPYLSQCFKMSNHFNRQIEQLSNLIAHVNFMQILNTIKFSNASIEWTEWKKQNVKQLFRKIEPFVN